MSIQELELEKKVYDLLKDSEVDLDYSAVKIIEAAKLTIDHCFGEDYSNQNPSIVFQLTESFMANLRANKINQTLVDCTKEIVSNL